MILALLLVSLVVKELILRSERKREDLEREERVTPLPALEKLTEAYPASLASLTPALAETPGMAADLLALADAVPNEASVEVLPEHQPLRSNEPGSNQPQYKQPQYNQEDARVE